MRRILLAIIALSAPSAFSGQPTVPLPGLPAAVLPPVLPWSGASERLIVATTDPWITPAERAGFATTPHYAETRAWLDRLAALSSLIHVETFGRTAQGRTC